MSKNVSFFLFCGLLFRHSISLNWYAGQVPVLAQGRGRQSYNIVEADIRSAVEMDFCSESFLEQKKIILLENLRMVAQDDAYVLQYF